MKTRGFLMPTSPPAVAQNVVVMAGGHGSLGTKMGDSLVAFALPDEAMGKKREKAEGKHLERAGGSRVVIGMRSISTHSPTGLTPDFIWRCHRKRWERAAVAEV